MDEVVPKPQHSSGGLGIVEDFGNLLDRRRVRVEGFTVGTGVFDLHDARNGGSHGHDRFDDEAGVGPAHGAPRALARGVVPTVGHTRVRDRRTG